jgi:uncharacterized protein YcaQ
MARERHGSVGPRVSWQQVAAFRLRRHHLLERAPRSALATVVRDMGGAQAQVPLAARISTWARVDGIRTEDLEAALWKHRTLSRAWCMRRTLHLVPSADVAVFVRGTARRAEREIRWMHNRGVAPDRLEELLDATLRAMDQPLTASELTERVCQSLRLRRAKYRGGGWGNTREIPALKLGQAVVPTGYLLHLVGARGVVCSGPSRGTLATYVRADAWVPHWNDVSPAEAERDLLRLYLRGFGPANASDFMAWTRILLTEARKIWAAEEPDLAPVDVEGTPGWVLRPELTELLNAKIEGPAVRLLPYFDSYLLGHLGREHLVERGDHQRVYRAQGWVSPTLLVNGRIAGVWTHRQKGERLEVHVTSFQPLQSTVQSRIREEARDLGRFLGCSTVHPVIG